VEEEEEEDVDDREPWERYNDEQDEDEEDEEEEGEGFDDAAFADELAELAAEEKVNEALLLVHYIHAS